MVPTPDSMTTWSSLSPAQQQAILDEPALPPPDGMVSNFANPPESNGEAFVLMALFSSLIAVASVLRWYSRIFIVKRIHLEDIIGLLSLGLYMAGLWTLVAYARKPGFYVHQYDIHLGDLDAVSYTVYVGIIVYMHFLLFAKTAILLEWVRLFVPAGTRDTFWCAAYTMITLNAVLYIIACLLTIFDCQPIDRYWKVWIDGTCITYMPIDIATASFNLAIDLFILLMPQKVIWSLHMERSKKIGVGLVFGMGLLACVCAVGRLYMSIIGFGADKIYLFGPRLLWLLSQETCVMLVFLVPGAAPVISRGHFVSRSMSSLSRWLGLSIPSSGSSDFGKVVPMTIGSAPTKRVYLHVNEDRPFSEIDLEMMGHGDGIR